MFLKTKFNDSGTTVEPETVQPFLLASTVSGWHYETTTLTPDHPSDLKELGWIIPAVLAAIIVMFILALLCFYGVRTTELCVMRWCYKKYGCCNPHDEEEYTSLKDAFDPESYSLNDISHHSTSHRQHLE